MALRRAPGQGQCQLTTQLKVELLTVLVPEKKRSRYRRVRDIGLYYRLGCR